MRIKSNVKNRQQYQKWLFAVSEMLSKIGIGFISNLLLKARVSYLTILKWNNFSLPFKVETDQFVICLVLPECLSVQICCIFTLREWSESWRRWWQVSFSVVFSASFKNSRALPKRKGWKSVFVLGLVGRVSDYPLLSQNIIFPPANNGCSREKILPKRFAHAISVHYQDFEHTCVYWIWLRGSASYVLIKHILQVIWSNHLNHHS